MDKGLFSSIFFQGCGTVSIDSLPNCQNLLTLSAGLGNFYAYLPD